MSVDTYRTVAGTSSAEFKDKGSRFIAFAYPIRRADEVKALLEPLRQSHHKARHWCYASRVGTDGLQFRANDDGEPAGSAGRPILGQIDSAALTDVLVVVVRYFGGTLLGVPGLIQAYKQATVLALQAASRLEKPILKTVNIQFAYEKMSEVMRLIKRCDAHIVTQQMDMQVSMEVAVPLAFASAFWQQLEDWHWLLIQKE